MSESENTEVAEQETKLGHNPRKRVRHRKKQIYENILKQMEFYFSDANLTKDRFLGDLVKSDPYVPLETFLKFNKIRAVTQDITDIAKAMKHSALLELSEDKLKVKRITSVQPYDAELRTIYVESIPVTANREWLKRVFAEYGEVAYISLPQFKNSHKIKGYGFIEFKKPEDAQKCLSLFTKMGCKLSTSMAPEELSSIKTFSIDESEQMESENDPSVKHVKVEEYEPPKKRKKNKDKKGKHLELKLDQESDSDKRAETPTPTTPSDENKSIIATPTEEQKTIDTESKDELTSQDEEMGDGLKKKKIRKRTAKDRNKAKNNIGPNEASKGALWGLQVLSKSEWKTLRNKYLNLQRKYMKEIKRNLQNRRYGYSGIPAPAASEAEPAINQQTTEANKTIVPLEKIPGVFVKEVLPEPCLDVRLTKRTIRSNVHALHVDAKEGQTEIVIRFDSAKAADEYCAQSSNRARVLSGGEQEEQWSRAEAARGGKRARGRDKLLERHDALTTAAALAPSSPQPTHTHIRFEDE